MSPTHPRYVCASPVLECPQVYEISPQGGTGSRASYYKADALYSHSFDADGAHFTAANMTHGPFGGVRGKDFIAVQSMDGQIAVYEQDHFAFKRKCELMIVFVRVCTRVCVCVRQYARRAERHRSHGIDII